MDMPGTRAAERDVEQSLRAEQDREQRPDRPTSCGQSQADHQDGKNEEHQRSERGRGATSGEMAEQGQAARAEPDDCGPDHAKCGHTLRLTPASGRSRSVRLVVAMIATVAVGRSMTHN